MLYLLLTNIFYIVSISIKTDDARVWCIQNFKMDSFTKEIMKEWGFSDELVELFKEEEIDREALFGLTESMISKLIPKLGVQSKFLKKLDELKQKKEIPAINQVYIASKEVPMVVDFNNLDDILGNIEENMVDNTKNRTVQIDNHHTGLVTTAVVVPHEVTISCKEQVKKVLRNSHDGILVLNYYESCGNLNQSMRNKLCSVLIKNHLGNENSKIDKFMFSALSQGIEELFPTETKETYFIPYFKEGHLVSPNRGKLYDKYCYLKKEIRVIEMANNKRKYSHGVNNDINLNEEDFEDSLQWLKNNIEPENTLFDLWKETALYRLSLIGRTNLNIYPALTKPTGYLLIDMDFDHMFPNKGLKLFQEFDSFKIKLIKYLEVKQPSLGSQGANLISRLISPAKPGDDDIAAFQILPFLFSPVSTVISKPGSTSRSTIRPSKIEQSTAFIVSIVNVNELKSVNTAKVNKAFSLGLTVQPYVVVVGNNVENSSENPMSYYTVINGTYYKLETITKSIDVCFKSFHTFDLKYPLEAIQIWTFVQVYFYKIQEILKDKTFISVKTLVSDLEKL